MASELRKLSDADLEHVHHMLRRDAHSDLAIAREAERRFGAPLWKSDGARSRAIARYRAAKPFRLWQDRWLAEQSDRERTLLDQQRRFEMVLSAVQSQDGSGFEKLSNAVLADMLAAVATMPAEAKAEAFGKSGWVKNLITAVQKQAALNMRAAADKAGEVAGDGTLSDAERRERIRAIFRVTDAKGGA